VSHRPGTQALTAAAPTRRTALAVLTLLTAINLLNYLDRYVVAPLKTDLTAAMGLSAAQFGLLGSVFILVYMLAAPLFGVWGDRGARNRPIAFGVGIWSVATLLSGLARSYPELLGARAVVGIGEAAMVAVAPALLADLFPVAARARIYAVFNMAIYVGAALGYVVGGQIATHFSWRHAFFLAGAPGLVLALASLTLPDPPRGIQDAPAAAPPGPALSPLARYAALLRQRHFMVVVAGYAAYTFALGGLAYWMPAFLELVRGVPKAAAATDFGKIVLVTGFLGTFAGGWLADYLLRHSRQAYLWFSGVVTLLAAPVAYLALASPDRHVYMPAIVVAELLLFTSTGPVNAAIINAVSPLERASAGALTIFVIHLFGDVPSPFLIGYLADVDSLARAVLIVPAAVLIAGIIWLAGARSAGSGAAAQP
jgi:MFS family permease